MGLGGKRKNKHRKQQEHVGPEHQWVNIDGTVNIRNEETQKPRAPSIEVLSPVNNAKYVAGDQIWLRLNYDAGDKHEDEHDPEELQVRATAPGVGTSRLKIIPKALGTNETTARTDIALPIATQPGSCKVQVWGDGLPVQEINYEVIESPDMEDAAPSVAPAGGGAENPNEEILAPL